MRRTLNQRFLKRWFGGFLFIVVLPGLVGSAAAEESNVRTNSIGMEMVLMPAGSFMTGSGLLENEAPFYRVTISRPFYLGKCEVTRDQWAAVMGNNQGKLKGGTNPVKRVSRRAALEEVQVFISKLNEKEGVTGYRLPTEEERKYAGQVGKLDCADGPKIDQLGPPEGSPRYGGSRRGGRLICLLPGHRSAHLGFRLAFFPDQ